MQVDSARRARARVCVRVRARKREGSSAHLPGLGLGDKRHDGATTALEREFGGSDGEAQRVLGCVLEVRARLFGRRRRRTRHLYTALLRRASRGRLSGVGSVGWGGRGTSGIQGALRLENAGRDGQQRGVRVAEEECAAALHERQVLCKLRGIGGGAAQ